MVSAKKTIEKKMAAILFADVKGYSSLTEKQLQRFFRHVLPGVGEIFRKTRPFFLNTWGDAVVAAFDGVIEAADSAINLRDLFDHYRWADAELPQLRMRTALHAGSLFVGLDPVTNTNGIIGSQVNLAARIEPVTPPGHVWATDTFISLLKQEPNPQLIWEDMGSRSLAKDWGNKHIYWLGRSSPAEHPVFPSESENNADRAIKNPSRAISTEKRFKAWRYLRDAIEGYARGTPSEVAIYDRKHLARWQDQIIGMIHDIFSGKQSDVYVAWLRPNEASPRLLSVYKEKNLNREYIHYQFQENEGLVGKSWVSGTPVATSKLQQHDWYVYREGCHNSSYLCAPVGSAGGIGGVIGVGSDKGFEIAEDDLEVLSAFAATLSVGLISEKA